MIWPQTDSSKYECKWPTRRFVIQITHSTWRGGLGHIWPHVSVLMCPWQQHRQWRMWWLLWWQDVISPVSLEVFNWKWALMTTDNLWPFQCFSVCFRSVKSWTRWSRRWRRKAAACLTEVNLMTDSMSKSIWRDELAVFDTNCLCLILCLMLTVCVWY